MIYSKNHKARQSSKLSWRYVDELGFYKTDEKLEAISADSKFFDLSNMLGPFEENFSKAWSLAIIDPSVMAAMAADIDEQFIAMMKAEQDDYNLSTSLDFSNTAPDK